MSDFAWLIIVVAAFYALECAVWVRPGDVLFRSQVGERHGARMLAPESLFRRSQGGFLFAHVAPTGESFVCQHWPVSLSPHGAFAYVAQAFAGSERPAQSERYVPWSDLKSSTGAGNDVLVNGSPFVTACSPRLAGKIAGLLEKLAGTPEAKRPDVIEAALAEILDAGALGRDLESHRAATALLRIASACLFAFWLSIPLHLGTGRPLRLGYLGVSMLVLVAFTLVASFLWRRQTGREAWPRRLGQLAILLVSPADAMHAGDHASRGALGTYHPLAAAQVLCSPRRFRDFARRVLRDVRHPLLPVATTADEAARATEDWFRGAWDRAVTQSVRAAGLDPDELLKAPTAEDAASRSYCDRCERQYALAEGRCEACGGRALRPLPGPGSATAAPGEPFPRPTDAV